MSEIITKPVRVAFVTGGSGFVGGNLIRVLIANGWNVRALARSSDAAAAVERIGARAVRAEMFDGQALRLGMEGSEVVFHVAAMFKLWGKRTDFDAVNVEGMRSLVNAAAATASVRKVVAISAAAVVMGDPEPMLAVNETAPVRERAFAPYGSSKSAGERVLLAANGARPGFETVSIRPPMIWGAGMPMLDHVVDTVKAGRWQWVDHGAPAMSTCHVDNLTDALLLAADKGRGGQAYFVADATDGTMRSVFDGLLATRGVTAPDKSVSFAMAWRIAGIMGAAWRLLGLSGEPPITRQMLRLIGKPFTVSIDKARKELGYVPSISWRTGLTGMADRS